MKFDDVLIDIGQFGPYQVKIYFLVCLIAIPTGMHQMAQVFIAGKMDHWCRVEGQEYNCHVLSPELYKTCMEDIKEQTAPIVYNEVKKTYEYDSCNRKTDEQDNATVACDAGWVYDQSQFNTSLISDFDLVCDKKKYPEYSQSIFFAGVLVGSFVFGGLADQIGRFPSYFITIGILAVTGVITAFSNSFWMWTVLRFIVAAANMGSFLIAFVIVTELVGPSKRVLAGISIEFFFAAGYMMDAVLAMFIPKWRILQLVISAPVFLFFLLIPIVPESARWLISKKQFSKADKIIRKIAVCNKTESKLASDYMQQIEKAELSTSSDERSPNFIDLYRTPNLRLRTVNLMFNWFVNSIVYYGLSLSTSDLGSNIYLAFFISGAVEVPAYLLSIVIVESVFGRRFSTFAFELLGGVACLCTIFMPLGALRTTVAMIGKFAISASFAIIYIFAAENFPTPLRSAGVGICSTSARVGGILAPIILGLKDFWEPFPVIVFGASSILAGFLVLLLPETRGRTLPETVQEGENFGNDGKILLPTTDKAEDADI